MDKVTMSDLLEAGVHLGHPTRRWHPKMKPYIHGARNGIYIFDLGTTMKGLAESCRFLYDTACNGGSILFVGTKRQAQEVVRDAAVKTGQHYMCERWLGGTLTNNTTIRKSIGRMQKIEKMEQSGELADRPKKEVASIKRVYSKLHRNLAGIVDLRRMPDAMVVIDIEREDIALREAQTLKIPVVALVDTNCDPDQVNHVIPGNDDALRSIKVVVDALTASVEAGQQVNAKIKAEEEAARQAEAEARKAEAEARKAEAAAKAEAKKAAAAPKAGSGDAPDKAAAKPAAETGATARPKKAAMKPAARKAPARKPVTKKPATKPAAKAKAAPAVAAAEEAPVAAAKADGAEKAD